MKINIVIVTYNRKECLKKLLCALENQTVIISNVLIFDNSSIDGTEKMLFGNDYIGIQEPQNNLWINHITPSFTVHYFKNSVNSGGSGGFAEVITHALTMPCDYVWIMDDDVEPENDCLEKMIRRMTKEIRACIPNRTDENFQDRPWVSFDLKKTYAPGLASRRKTYVDPPLTEESYFVYDMPFEGPLVSYDVLKKIGIPNAEYFIICDDTDYALRILKETKILFVTNATLHRQLALLSNTQVAKFEYNWKIYYAIRNYIVLMKKHGKGWSAKYLNILFNWMYWNYKAIMSSDKKNISIVNRAIFDAVFNKKGKTVNPGEF